MKRVRYALTRYFWMVPASQQPIADGYPYPMEGGGTSGGSNSGDIGSSRVRRSDRDKSERHLSGFKRVSALQMFGRDEEVYAQLFPLLQRREIGSQVWDILNLLPPSFVRVQKVIALGFERKLEHSVWDRLFDRERPYQLLYNVQILCSVLSGEEWKREYFGNNVLRQRFVFVFVLWTKFQVFVEMLIL